MLHISLSGKGVCLQDKSANQTAWQSLLQQIDACSSLSLKQPPNFASPDAIFVGNILLKTKEYCFTVGIAGKNYFQKDFIASIITDECDKFSAIFQGSKSGRKSSLNILMICATKPNKG